MLCVLKDQNSQQRFHSLRKTNKHIISLACKFAFSLVNGDVYVEQRTLTVNVFVIYCSQMICVTALRTHLPRFERKDPEQNRVTRGKSFPFSIVPLVRPCACSCVERAMPVV